MYEPTSAATTSEPHLHTTPNYCAIEHMPLQESSGAVMAVLVSAAIEKFLRR